MTLTLAFQGELLKKQHFRYGKIYWQINDRDMSWWMLDPRCHLELCPWPWDFKAKFWNNRMPGMADWRGKKRCESVGCFNLVIDERTMSTFGNSQQCIKSGHITHYGPFYLHAKCNFNQVSTVVVVKICYEHLQYGCPAMAKNHCWIEL